jgi:hypothetical protein
VVDTVDMLV